MKFMKVHNRKKHFGSNFDVIKYHIGLFFINAPIILVDVKFRTQSSTDSLALHFDKHQT